MTELPRNVEYLLENGPSTSDEVPEHSMSVRDRQHGVWKFDVTFTTTKRSHGGQTRTVYYLEHEHEKTSVIEKWLSANQTVENSVSRSKLRQAMRSYGRNFHEAIDDVYPMASECEA